MNTTDVLASLGGKPANFLDTGGKATSQTVSQSFRTILTDPSVTAIFVSS
jgi:succinyl-CoA synthetase alpha subunit